jgi:hypothetical protein
MKTWILMFALLLGSVGMVKANTLTWIDNSDNEDGFIVEMLQGGVFVETARTPASLGVGAQYTYTDTNSEGVYQVRAFKDLGVDGLIISGASNKAGRLKGPVNLQIN